MSEQTQGPATNGAPEGEGSSKIETGDVLRPMPPELRVGSVIPANGVAPLVLVQGGQPAGGVVDAGAVLGDPEPTAARPRRRVYECTRAHAQTLATVLEHACTVVPAQGEDADKVARFKYAAGRNLGRFQKIREESDRLYYEGGPVPPARRDEFYDKFKTMMESFADLDPETKAPIYHQDGSPKITGDNIAKASAARQALEAEYPEIRAWGLARDAYRRDLAYELVAVPVHTFPFDRMPQLLSGAFMSDLSFMFYGEAVDQPAGFAVCHYCGEEFPADGEDSGLALTAHLGKCAKHPMRQLEAALADVRAFTAELLNDKVPGWDKDQTELCIRAQEVMRLRPAPPVVLPKG